MHRRVKFGEKNTAVSMETPQFYSFKANYLLRYILDGILFNIRLIPKLLLTQ